MTLINPLSNFSMDNFMSGLSNWFTPKFSCSFMPSFMNFSAFTPISNWNFSMFNDWNMPSLFNFSPFGNNFGFNNSSLSTSIWNDVQSCSTPTFDSFSLSTFDNSYRLSSTGIKTTTKIESENIRLSTKVNSSVLKNYNANAGKKLVNLAMKYSNFEIDHESKKVTSISKPSNKSIGDCALYVKAAIRDVGLGAYQYGHAYQMTSILRNNPNFKEISPRSVNLKDLPAGCVLVYNKGVGGYSKDYGHTEITTGNGSAVSDFITKKLKKTPSTIFIPV